MKKIIYSILIFMVAIGSFMAPISGALNQNGGIDIVKNEARAGEYDISFTLSAGKVNDDSAEININIKPGPTYGGAAGYELFGLEWSEKSKNFSDEPEIKSVLELQNAAKNWNLWNTAGTNNSTYADLQNYANGKNIQFKIVKNLVSEQEYFVRIKGFQFSSNDTFEKSRVLTTPPLNFKTTAPGQGPQIGGQTGVFDPNDTLPDCGVTSFSELGGCIIQIVYYLFWMPSSWIASFAGKILDFFVFFSIDSASYNQSGFVNEGWGVVRDIANIAFIFVLLYIAIRTILNMGNDSKKMIVNVIIIALLINFSLFFTKVIVDSGNILAGVLYNDISSTQNGVVVADNGVKNISEAIVSKFDPQKIMASSGVTKENANDMKTPFLVVIIMATIVNIYMIITFISVAFLFVGRVIGLMISMIFSPFAFMSLTVPGSGKLMEQWSWEKWFPELISMTLMAPIFIFFLWLILKFLDTGLVKGLVENSKNIDFSQAFKNIVTVLVPFILILGLLQKAKEKAKEMAGEIGAKINEYAGKAVGLVGGAALGGAALLGRATLGRLAAGQLEGAGGEALRERAARGEAGARLQLRAFEGISKATFEARGGELAKALEKETGIGLATRIPLIGTPLVKTEGGYRGAVERETKRAAERAELFKAKGPEAAVQDLKAKEWETKYNKDRDAAQQAAKSAGIAFKEVDFKKMYEAGTAEIKKDPKDPNEKPIYSVVGAPKVLNAAETNAKRMRNQADNIQYGKNYVEERDKTVDQNKKDTATAIATGKTPPPKFDEETFRKTYMAKNADYDNARKEAETKANRLGMTFNEKVWREEEYFNKKLSRSEQETAGDLRKKAGEEEKKEKPLSTRERNILAAKLDQVNAKFSESVKILKKIADDNTAVTGGDVSKVTEAMVTGRMTELKSREARFDTYVSVWQKRLKAARAGTVEEVRALANLTKANRNKAMVRDVIHHTENVIENTNRTEENINDLNTKLS